MLRKPLARFRNQPYYPFAMPPASDSQTCSGRGTNRAFFLPRLAGDFYRGDAVIHWTLPTAGRATGWLDDSFHACFRETMLHAAAREGLLCPVYCLMPDHIHLIWMGLRPDTNQRSGMKFLREHVAAALHPHHFQHQAHDHVLRDDERRRRAFAKICFYILANPVRARLIKDTEKWPFEGAIIPGYPTLHPLDEDFQRLFWKLYSAARAPGAGERKLPMRA